ncbi:MAG: cysteine hydrolase [Acidobacteriota bacterium]|nr:cysteine hydrolase [Acidobacteriota bacterium]
MSDDNSWLVIIDMQTIFREAGKWPCPRFDEILSPIRQLAAQYRGRTLLTRFVDPPQKNGSWVPYYETFPFANVPDTDALYDIVEELADLVTPGNVVTMTTFSKWGDEQNGIRSKTGAYPHLLLTGVATDCCVLSTAMSAAEAGAFVTVAMNACAASSDQNQIAAEQILNGYAPLISLQH